MSRVSYVFGEDPGRVNILGDIKELATHKILKAATLRKAAILNHSYEADRISEIRTILSSSKKVEPFLSNVIQGRNSKDLRLLLELYDNYEGSRVILKLFSLCDYRKDKKFCGYMFEKHVNGKNFDLIKDLLVKKAKSRRLSSFEKIYSKFPSKYKLLYLVNLIDHAVEKENYTAFDNLFNKYIKPNKLINGSHIIKVNLKRAIAGENFTLANHLLDKYRELIARDFDGGLLKLAIISRADHSREPDAKSGLKEKRIIIEKLIEANGGSIAALFPDSKLDGYVSYKSAVKSRVKVKHNPDDSELYLLQLEMKKIAEASLKASGELKKHRTRGRRVHPRVNSAGSDSKVGPSGNLFQ